MTGEGGRVHRIRIHISTMRIGGSKLSDETQCADHCCTGRSVEVMHGLTLTQTGVAVSMERLEACEPAP